MVCHGHMPLSLASSPCNFTSLYTCFRSSGQKSLTYNLTCNAASTAISCFNRLVRSGRIAGCDASEKRKIGQKLSEAKKMQLATCQSEILCNGSLSSPCINCITLTCSGTQCSYGGKSYQNGDSFPASDGCNTWFVPVWSRDQTLNCWSHLTVLVSVCTNGTYSCTRIGCGKPFHDTAILLLWYAAGVYWRERYTVRVQWYKAQQWRNVWCIGWLQHMVTHCTLVGYSSF